MFKVFFGMKVSGREHIPRGSGFIVASNHLSYLDPLVLGAACPQKLNYMARKSLFRNSFFAKILLLCQAFPVKRNSPDLSALKEALARIKDKKGLAVFPEGRRAEGNRMETRPQPGVGFLALKAAVPVIPALIKGTDLVLPKGARFLKLRKIEVSFGEKIFLERRKPNNYQEIADEIMQRIRHLH